MRRMTWTDPGIAALLCSFTAISACAKTDAPAADHHAAAAPSNSPPARGATKSAPTRVQARSRARYAGSESMRLGKISLVESRKLRGLGRVVLADLRPRLEKVQATVLICYRQTLSVGVEGAKQRVEAELDILPSGKTANVVVTGQLAKGIVGPCLTSALNATRFLPGPVGGSLRLRLVLELQPGPVEESPVWQ